MVEDEKALKWGEGVRSHRPGRRGRLARAVGADVLSLAALLMLVLIARILA